MAHYCRICGRYRANERFSGRGHRDHICKECSRLPKEQRQAIEQRDEIYGMMEQRNISDKNLARLRTLARSPNAEIAEIARLVLEVGTLHPRKRKRLGFLAHEHRDLLSALEERGLTGVW